MVIRRIGTPVTISKPSQKQTIQKRAAGLPIKSRPAAVHPLKDFDTYLSYYPSHEFFTPAEFIAKWLMPYMSVRFEYGRWVLATYPVTKIHVNGMEEVIGLTVFFLDPGKKASQCPKLRLLGDKHTWGHRIVQYAINHNL